MVSTVANMLWLISICLISKLPFWVVFSINFLWMIRLLIWFGRLLSFHFFLFSLLFFIDWYLITIFKLIEFQQKVYISFLFNFEILGTNWIQIWRLPSKIKCIAMIRMNSNGWGMMMVTSNVEVGCTHSTEMNKWLDWICGSHGDKLTASHVFVSMCTLYHTTELTSECNDE